MNRDLPVRAGELIYLAQDGLTIHALGQEPWYPSGMTAAELAALRIGLLHALIEVEKALHERGLLDRVTTPRSAPTN